MNLNIEFLYFGVMNFFFARFHGYADITILKILSLAA